MNAAFADTASSVPAPPADTAQTAATLIPPRFVLEAKNGHAVDIIGSMLVTSLEPGEIVHLTDETGAKKRHFKIIRVDAGVPATVYLQEVRKAYLGILVLTVSLVVAWFALQALFDWIF